MNVFRRVALLGWAVFAPLWSGCVTIGMSLAGGDDRPPPRAVRFERFPEGGHVFVAGQDRLSDEAFRDLYREVGGEQAAPLSASLRPTKFVMALAAVASGAGLAVLGATEAAKLPCSSGTAACQGDVEGTLLGFVLGELLLEAGTWGLVNAIGSAPGAVRALDDDSAERYAEIYNELAVAHCAAVRCRE
jgi:hypothetical protein